MTTNGYPAGRAGKIIYWIATLWLASGLLAGGLQQLFQTQNFVVIFEHLEYPLYLMYILGAWKILATIAILVPRFRLLKEWAYAGSFFVWSGALVSHIALGDALTAIMPSVILLLLTILSWYFRPENRKFSGNFNA
jgi:hypothetical protein